MTRRLTVLSGFSLLIYKMGAEIPSIHPSLSSRSVPTNHKARRDKSHMDSTLSLGHTQVAELDDQVQVRIC